jgi:hypothetical protein
METPASETCERESLELPPVSTTLVTLSPLTEQYDAVEDGESEDKWWLRVGDYFEFVHEKDGGKNVVFNCKLCKPKTKSLCAAKNSNANLKKHVQVSQGNTY